jgi:hypothetical protein
MTESSGLEFTSDTPPLTPDQSEGISLEDHVPSPYSLPGIDANWTSEDADPSKIFLLFDGIPLAADLGIESMVVRMPAAGEVLASGDCELVRRIINKHEGKRRAQRKTERRQRKNNKSKTTGEIEKVKKDVLKIKKELKKLKKELRELKKVKEDVSEEEASEEEASDEVSESEEETTKVKQEVKMETKVKMETNEVKMETNEVKMDALNDTSEFINGEWEFDEVTEVAQCTRAVTLAVGGQPLVLCRIGVGFLAFHWSLRYTQLTCDKDIGLASEFMEYINSAENRRLKRR